MDYDINNKINTIFSGEVNYPTSLLLSPKKFSRKSKRLTIINLDNLEKKEEEISGKNKKKVENLIQNPIQLPKEQNTSKKKLREMNTIIIKNIKNIRKNSDLQKTKKRKKRKS